MRMLAVLILVPLALLLSHCSPPPWGAGAGKAPPARVVGIHLLGWSSDSLLVELGRTLPSLAAQGVNLIVLEVDYSFEFQSHPELREGDRYITRDGARRFAALCRRSGIRLVPQFQSLGHQSWAQYTGPLLTRYPELDLTPGAFPNNEGLYCREWDPTNPRVNQIVFALIDEIVDAFDADAVHVGMDEIFLLGSEKSPSTRGKDPAELFAKVVNEFHGHFVRDEGLEMFMWGDRLIDGRGGPYGEYESSLIGTARAVDLIPKDIIICDWHYEPMRIYPSVAMFIEKGFRVLPSSWRDLEGVEALMKYSCSRQSPRMIGHLFTTWSRPEPRALVGYEPMVRGLAVMRSGRWYDVAFQLSSVSPTGVLQVTLDAPAPDLAVHFTTDGSEPTPQSARYEGPVSLDHSATIRAIACRQGEVVSDVRAQTFVVHCATGRPVTLVTPPSTKYPPQGGAEALVNGVTGSSSYADGQWVGLEGPDLDAVIDLGSPAAVGRVSLGSLHNPAAWIHRTPLVEVFGSTDGQTFTPLGTASDPGGDAAVTRFEVTCPATTARYVRVVAHNRIIPAGFEGAGSPAWIFVDEITVD